MLKQDRMPKVVDLFAGCGGLSLGLERAGFETVFVNELHPDAMATYLINRPNSLVQNKKNYAHDIYEITRTKTALSNFADYLKREHGEIDLVVGGPPCQGYSGIGIRRTFDIDKVEIPTNHLYKEMAKVIKNLAPKVFIFENVRGLLTSRWTPNGVKGEIWQDVLGSFQKLIISKNGRSFQYQIGFELVHAKDFGVPQNRPRIIMIGIREDLVGKNSLDIGPNNLNLNRTFNYPNPSELLSDLVDPKWIPGSNTDKYLFEAKNNFQRNLRTHHLTGKALRKGDVITEHDYSKHSDEVIKKFTYMLNHDGQIHHSMKTKKFAQRLLPASWPSTGPNITATSLPDDYVHFSQPRVLTVREWARLQTFPDSYQFIGKRTTGGRRRAGNPETGEWARDLPKYTQIGNAVPVELAKMLGEQVLKILELEPKTRN